MVQTECAELVNMNNVKSRKVCERTRRRRRHRTETMTNNQTKASEATDSKTTTINQQELQQPTL